MRRLDRKLDFFLKHNMNLLLSGEAGFGKTAMIKQCFDRNNINWVYFSAATMDPWVDFVGIPKEKTDEATGITYLELVRPKAFAFDEVEAIFLDEFNRAPAKVRNAALELIQFKSINGKRFEKLRVVWAAINPFDEEGTYNVEQLDPAQEDRFHAKIEVPSVPDQEFFNQRFGEKRGKVAVDWWHAHTKEAPKNKISARRLEYAVDAFENDGDIRDFLPKGANAQRLVVELSSGSILDRFKEVVDRNDADEMKKFLKSDNSYTVAVGYAMKEKPALVPRIARALNDERLVAFLLDHEAVIPVLLKGANITQFYHAFCVVLDSPRISATNLRAIKEALATRFPTQSSHEIQYYEVPISSLISQLEFTHELKTAVNGSITSMEKNQCVRLYDFLLNNLSINRIANDDIANDIICMCFRVMEYTKVEKVHVEYPELVAMLNTALKYHRKPDGRETFNTDHKETFLFHRSPRRIRAAAKVQKVLDSSKLTYKPRII